jgi:hypothetical protein
VLGIPQSDLESLEIMTGSKDRATEMSDHRCESVATLFDLNVFQMKGGMQSFVPTLWVSTVGIVVADIIVTDKLLN